MKEKSQAEMNAAKRQAELIGEALGNAADNNRVWLNAEEKTAPRLWPKGVAVSPFNALIMGLHSDRTGSHTNLFLPFTEAMRNNTAVREHERGVPFLYYNWNKYVNRNNPDDTISRADYLKLSEEQQRQYKGIHNREIRTLFTIDQTIMPMSKEKDYAELLKTNGTAEDRGVSEMKDNEEAVNAQHIAFNDFLLKMQANLVKVKSDGSGIAHYDTEKDAVYLPLQKDYEHYSDYMQEAIRQIVSATGHQQRLAREGMVMQKGMAPSEDAVKQERLVVELASGVKMQEMGLPARLSAESMKMVDYWKRELAENPCLVDAIESDVNNALTVIRKAEQGEKIEYATMRNVRETAELQDALPKHYTIADEIKKHPDIEGKTIVVVTDAANKSADVILPQGASLEPKTDIQGMSKQRIQTALKRDGIENVRFFNPDGAWGYRPDDTQFEGKQIDIARLRNWSLERLSQLDIAPTVSRAREVGFEQVQMIQDDKNRWALYLKPEGKEGYSVYPDKADLNQFFTTLKQSMDNINDVRNELAQKYYAKAETQPELKVDLFGGNTEGGDMNRIDRVSLFKTTANGTDKPKIFCSAMIDGQRQTAQITSSQWQRMWIAEDKQSYKKHLAATLFADVLKQDVSHERTASEKTEVETEVKQEEHIATDKHEEEHREYHEEEDKATSKEKSKEQTEAKSEEKSAEEKKKQKQESALIRQWKELKAKHPDALLLFRVGDFYEMYEQDAKRGSEILGVTLTRRNGADSYLAGFPHHALDTYLPKLIRAGERVAICDQLEAPKRLQKTEEAQEESRSRGMKR